AGTADIVHAWPRGKLLGGSSSINGMTWMRGAPADFDGWAASGCPGWAADDVANAFTAFETYTGAASGARGRSGAVRIQHFTDVSPLTHCFLKACEQLGYSRSQDFNGPDPQGFGVHQANVDRGRRQSASIAFLYPVLDRRNLSVYTDTTVHRLLWDDRAS